MAKTTYEEIPREGLTFNELRKMNLKRLPHFKNSKGVRAHIQPDGSDWTPADWMVATLGELGEAANILKKVRRGDLTLNEAMPQLADELADVQIYLDIMAFQLGVDLGNATINKWNKVSQRTGSPLRLGDLVKMGENHG